MDTRRSESDVEAEEGRERNGREGDGQLSDDDVLFCGPVPRSSKDAEVGKKSDETTHLPPPHRDWLGSRLSAEKGSRRGDEEGFRPQARLGGRKIV